jgi:cytoskeletal protein CcmA (bactofilin family)
VLGMRPKDSDETDAAPTTDRRQVSVIGKGMKVVGDCECEGDLRVDGTVTGNVRAPRLHIAESGSVAGDVSPLEDAAGEGVFSIAGRVGGAVRAAEVEVRKGGFVVGTVMADRAVVHGHVGGGIVVKDRLALEATAEVEGDIQARRLAIKEGGQFDGKIRMTETPPRERAAPVVAAAATPLSAP